MLSGLFTQTHKRGVGLNHTKVDARALRTHATRFPPQVALKNSIKALPTLILSGFQALKSAFDIKLQGNTPTPLRKLRSKTSKFDTD